MKHYSVLVRLQKECGYRNVRPSLFQSHRSSVQSSGSSCHCFSSSSKEQPPAKEEDVVLLYHRDAERNTAPRGAFAFSILNSTYWLWYVFDFIPAVNASPIADLHINPAIGLGGLALGAAINVVTGLYPSLLISKLSYNPSLQRLYLWKHDLPWIRQSSTPIEYPLGDIQLTTANNPDTQRLLHNSATYKGHLGISIKDQQIPWLMEIRESSEVLDAQLLLQALLDPRALSQPTSNDIRSRRQQQKKNKMKKKKRRS